MQDLAQEYRRSIAEAASEAVTSITRAIKRFDEKLLEAGLHFAVSADARMRDFHGPQEMTPRAATAIEGVPEKGPDSAREEAP